MQIGRFETNNIYCEDSYKAIKDIPDKSIDCIYTDIPYFYVQQSCGSSELGQRTARRKMELMGVDYDKNKFISSQDLTIAKHTDSISLENGIDYAILDEFVRVMKKINIFIWCSKLQILDIMKFFVEKHECFFEILCWCKTNPTPTANNTWLPDVEYCLYFREKGVVLNDGYELKSKWYKSAINKKDKDKFAHPTCKPVQLIEQHIKHTTQPNDIVADFFLGSGSTAVACKNTGRNYLGFEIQPKWFQIAKDRLNNVDANGQIGMFTV